MNIVNAGSLSVSYGKVREGHTHSGGTWGRSCYSKNLPEVTRDGWTKKKERSGISLHAYASEVEDESSGNSVREVGSFTTSGPAAA